MNKRQAENPNGLPIRVVIADDNPDILRVLAEIINSETDLECVGQVGAADEVLSTAVARNAKVVILDLQLGPVSGIEILKRGRAELPGVAFMIFSGHDGPEFRRQATLHGAADFLTKPTDLELLAARIRKVVSAKSYS